MSALGALGRPSDEAPGAEVARDMARRGLMILPVVMLTAWLVASGPVALSIAYAMIIVLANFLLSAYLLKWAASISLGLIPSVALGGYAMRLGLIFVAVWTIRDMSWVRMIPLGITIIATHLGLLAWELRYISASFAHPGLKPSPVANATGGRMRGRGSRPAAGYRPADVTRQQSNPVVGSNE